MGNLTAGVAWAYVAGILGAIVLIGNATATIVKAVKAVRSPNKTQDERLDALEAWRKEVDRKLLDDFERFKTIEDGNRVTHRALLALLDHGLDGNNVHQMQVSKEELQNHLINR